MPRGKTTFGPILQKDFPFLRQTHKDDPHTVSCTICGVTFKIGHGGRFDIKMHVKTKRHSNSQALKDGVELSQIQPRPAAKKRKQDSSDEWETSNETDMFESNFKRRSLAQSDFEAVTVKTEDSHDLLPELQYSEEELEILPKRDNHSQYFKRLQNQMDLMQHSQIMFQKTVDFRLNHIESLMQSMIRKFDRRTTSVQFETAPIRKIESRVPILDEVNGTLMSNPPSTNLNGVATNQISAGSSLPQNFKPMRRNPIYNYYNVVDTTKKTMSCKCCSKEITISTGSLMRHIQRMHPDANNLYLMDVDRENEKKNSDIKMEAGLHVASESDGTEGEEEEGAEENEATLEM